jgi:hypothetical protein
MPPYKEVFDMPIWGRYLYEVDNYTWEVGIDR